LWECSVKGTGWWLASWRKRREGIELKKDWTVIPRKRRKKAPRKAERVASSKLLPKTKKKETKKGSSNDSAEPSRKGSKKEGLSESASVRGCESALHGGKKGREVARNLKKLMPQEG